MNYIVLESTPGYMPDADEPAEFETYAEACEYANELAQELEEQGYECDRWASSQNTYAIYCQLPREATEAPDLGRYIEVLSEEGSV
jgi:hypothetical protein